jgi:hypothetical protein
VLEENQKRVVSGGTSRLGGSKTDTTSTSEINATSTGSTVAYKINEAEQLSSLEDQLPSLKCSRL